VLRWGRLGRHAPGVRERLARISELPEFGRDLTSLPVGIVYLNLTGKTKSLALPTDQTYYDRSGQRVREITLDDLAGDYVLARPGSN
jgi:hypothetical protein